MRHRPLERALATLLLVWFALVTVEPVALHACPVHGWASAAATDDHGGHAPVAPAHSDDGDGQHQCACIGDCAAAPAAAGLPATRVVLFDAATRRVQVVVPSAESPSATAPEFLRPYANGPPAGHRIA
jgi:hypothetical protein